jgi:twitching motility protein PilT
LATFIDHILKTREGHTITLEDPIEYVFNNSRPDYRGIISQREFGLGRDFTDFAKAIVAGLRQAPNVFMVGEIRDPETANAALQAAETGHLVLATLHTRNAAETVSRYVDIFPESIRDMIRLQFALNTLGIICQRLIPRADGQGRVAAFEILSMSPACKHVIRENRLQQISSYMMSQDSVQFDAYLAKLIQNRLVTRETGLLCANDPKELERLLTPK